MIEVGFDKYVKIQSIIIPNIIKNMINDRLLKIIPIVGFGFSLIFSIFISIFSKDIIFWPPDLSYIGFRNITIFYDIPLKLSLITLTIWGILIAYNTYLQTKEMFIQQNRPWISAGNYIKSKETKDKLIIIIDILNYGTTPAFNLKSNLEAITNNYRIKIKDLIKSEITVFPNGIVSEYFEIEKTKLNKENPIIEISSNITYQGIDKEIKTTKGNYQYNYLKNETTNLGEVCT